MTFDIIFVAALIYRQQQRPDAPTFSEQDVIRAHRRSGGHGFQHDAPRPERLAQWRGHREKISPGTDQEMIDRTLRTRRIKHPRQHGLIDLARRRYRACPDAVRQAQQRTSVGHAGEAKTAVAVSVDRRRIGKVRVCRGHSNRHVARPPARGGDLERNASLRPVDWARCLTPAGKGETKKTVTPFRIKSGPPAVTPGEAFVLPADSQRRARAGAGARAGTVGGDSTAISGASGTYCRPLPTPR
jgi:hypothetical protein